jgi:beta-1,4-mannosyl-glycoprotein beta-1,4-N-acetylglucosaminyltransferase
MKIIDCFTFYNELDVLKVRLEELYDVVDHFILVEATKTHAGNDKPLYYKDNKESFNNYNDKIIHIVIDFPQTNDSWVRENYQRNCIDLGIKQLIMNDNDIIIISDLDEIPNFDVMRSIKDNKVIINNNQVYSIEMTLYYYDIETSTNRKWYFARLLNYFTYNIINSPQSVRMRENYSVIPTAGWHLSYFGNESFIINKLESFAEHTMYSPEGKNKAYLTNCIKNRILHYNHEQLIYIPLETNRNLPKHYLKLSINSVS